MDHNKNKRNYQAQDGDNIIETHYKNPTCGDVMTLFLMVENEILKEVTFLGDGCSISMASASMMTERLKNKPLSEAFAIRQAMERLIRDGMESEGVNLGDSLSLKGVHSLKARHNCALMPWQALDKALAHNEKYTQVDGEPT
ncbi:SUF system NifU family Fe-S cluster assembly protein [Bacillus sp. RO3]|nr:SUF system NifU family Fe-S cluster assembly protein [Bacillus sp. RO3]